MTWLTNPYRFGGAAPGPGPSDAAHRYWAARIGRGQDDVNLCMLAELEIAASVGGADQCTGGTPLASSSYGSSTPDPAFDDDPDTYWASALGSVNLPAWIGYDFGAPVTAAEFTAQARGDGTGQYAPIEMDFVWSDDGTNYFPALSVENGAAWALGETRTYDATGDAAATHSDWRIYMRLIKNSPNAGEIDIREIEMAATLGGVDLCVGGTASGTPAVEYLDRAFDDDTATTCQCINQHRHFVQYTFASPVCIKQARLTMNAVVSAYPTDFVLQFKNAAGHWKTAGGLYSQSGWSSGDVLSIDVT